MQDDAGVDHRQWVLRTVDQFEVRLLRFSARLLGDEDAARDAVQHAFLRLCGESQKRIGGREGPWLFAVCRHRAIDVLRRRENTSTADQFDAADCPDESLDPAAAAEQADLHRSINHLVDQLPVSQREALLLWAEGFCYADIAEMTKTTEGNVRVTVHRAIKRLRESAVVKQMMEVARS